jgi:hypothetical protein
LLNLALRSILAGHGKIVLRKLYVSVGSILLNAGCLLTYWRYSAHKLTSLALHLASKSPPQWSDWVMGCVAHLSGGGASSEPILEFLGIVAEEVGSADLLGGAK